MKIHWIAITLLVLTTSAQAQPAAGDRQSAQEDAYNTYVRCVRVYAIRFIKSEALAADVADAAMSACQDRYQDLLNTTSQLVGNLPAAQTLMKDTRETARSFAVRTVLEARFPLR
jgi:hypothetical protein